MASSPPVVLTIAGFDPSSGAGVTADIKTISAHGCYGIACITAMTVQSTQGVRRVVGVSAGLITDTLIALANDMPIAAVHIGMLGNAAAVRAVIDFQLSHKLRNLVLDPVLRSSSGAPLIDQAGRDLLLSQLVPFADVITPNLEEASSLAGLAVTNLDDMKAAAVKLHGLGCRSVVITGGHLNPPIDLLSFPAKGGFHQREFYGEFLDSRSTHGTGCAFSTAVACNLALGQSLPDAVGLAKTYVAGAIAHGQGLGQGTGPVNHLYRSNG